MSKRRSSDLAPQFHSHTIVGGPHPHRYALMLFYSVAAPFSAGRTAASTLVPICRCPSNSNLLTQLARVIISLPCCPETFTSGGDHGAVSIESAKMFAYLVASATPSFQPLFPKYSRLQSPHAKFYPLMAETSSKPSESSTDTSEESPAATSSALPAAFAKPPNPPKRLSSGPESSNDPSPRPGKRPRPNPPPLTAAAALHGKQRADNNSQIPSTKTSVNPAKQALSALSGSDHGATSPIPDAALAPATAISEPLSVVAQNLQETPNDVPSDAPAQTSPASLSSVGTLEGTVAFSGLESTTVDSPQSIGEVSQEPEASPDKGNQEGLAAEEGPKAFSYPGPTLEAPTQPSRGMSLPGPESRNPERPSSNKKHRCPYCATEFTRHHNLKSHLLTHSHEKPYVCQTCQLRFRRLHDLKRHTKLHTGERPHICPKCGRKFARGDALARHNKGPGGCAGRRSSTGSFGADDDYDGANDESMDSLVYGEPETMDEDEASGSGRQSVPSIRRQAPAVNVSGQGAEQGSFQARQPSTYPPIQGRPPGGLVGGLFPPPAGPAGSGSSTSKLSPTSTTTYPSAPGISANLHPAGTVGPIFPPGSMTESPKPLSPGAAPGSHTEGGLYRNRSPSMTSQFQQQPYGRGSGRRSPPVVSMGSSLSTTGQLPPPHPSGLNPPDARYTLASQGPAHPPTGPTGPPTHVSGGAMSSQSNSLSSHGHSAKGSGESTAATFGPREDRLWAYVRSLEDRINGLQGEVVSLKEQLAAATQSNPR